MIQIISVLTFKSAVNEWVLVHIMPMIWPQPVWICSMCIAHRFNMIDFWLKKLWLKNLILHHRASRDLNIPWINKIKRLLCDRNWKENYVNARWLMADDTDTNTVQNNINVIVKQWLPIFLLHLLAMCNSVNNN